MPIKNKETEELDELREEIRQWRNMQVGAKRGWDYSGRAAKCESARVLVHKAAKIKRRYSGSLEAENLWRRAAEDFNQAREDCFPPEFWSTDIKLLSEGNPAGLEAAIEFLEADPWFDTAGYVKEELIKCINRIELTDTFKARLAKVILGVVDARDRREFRRYCRLARKVDSSDLRTGLDERLASADDAVRRRARWVMSYLKTQANS